MNKILKYVGVYYIEQTLNKDKTKSKNKDDNYIKFKQNEAYRFSDTELALLIKSSGSAKSIIQKLEDANIKVWEYISANTCEEAILIINESDIHNAHNVLKFYKIGSKDQLKEKLEKDRRKEERDLEKLKLKEQSLVK